IRYTESSRHRFVTWYSPDHGQGRERGTGSGGARRADHGGHRRPLEARDHLRPRAEGDAPLQPAATPDPRGQPADADASAARPRAARPREARVPSGDTAAGRVFSEQARTKPASDLQVGVPVGGQKSRGRREGAGKTRKGVTTWRRGVLLLALAA